jgi:hypothetical protein
LFGGRTPGICCMRSKNSTIAKPKPISETAVRTHDIIVRSSAFEGETGAQPGKMAVCRDPYFKPARAWGGTCICHIRRLFADVPHTLSTAIFWALYEGTIRFFIRPRGAGAVQLQAGALAAPPRSAAASHISLGSKVSAANMVRITTASRQQASRPWPAPKYDEEKGDLAP